MDRLSAADLLDLVLDDFTRWDGPLVDVPTSTPYDASPRPDPSTRPDASTRSDASARYAAELAAAREKTGLDEAVITGEGLLRGRRVAVVACEFGFLAGSIGVAAAERLVTAVERATTEGLPLLAATASGGTRMQEGTVAFLQMVKIAAAVARHKAAGLPYLVYLRHPTTGGVFASWGSLGHVTVAEPGAMIGFLGPRVYEALYDEFSRRPDRPGVRQLLRYAANNVVPLNGTGQGETDPGLLLALARFGTAPCVVLGQDRRAQTDGGQDRGGSTELSPMGPAALREARRGMRLAAELGLPLVTIIDTPGGALSQAAEEGGMAGEIARCLAELVTLEAPTVSVLLGQGTGGAALALVPADRVLAALHGWLSPLPPEGASAIVWRDTAHAPEMAAAQGVRSADLLAHGIVDRVIPEHPDAADEPKPFCLRLGQALEHELHHLTTHPPPSRHTRYRHLGLP